MLKSMKTHIVINNFSEESLYFDTWTILDEIEFGKWMER
jgi:hypothetical protein